jgi:calcium-dependent protein kinase
MATLRIGGSLVPAATIVAAACVPERRQKAITDLISWPWMMGQPMGRRKSYRRPTLHCERFEYGWSERPGQTFNGQHHEESNFSFGTSIVESDFLFRLTKTKFEDDFEILDELGAGGFGSVHKVRHNRLGLHGAAKMIPKRRDNRQELLNEIDALRKLDHPHIVKLQQVYDGKKDICLILELCNGPSLLSLIQDSGRLTEQESARALRHMLKAVQCCHVRHIGHFDIKPENFMFKDANCDVLKMIDLGLSGGFKDRNEIVGTPVYSAPETQKGIYGPQADIWSCGTVLFLMVTGEPFCDMHAQVEEVEQLKQDRNWIRQRLEWASRQHVSAECIDLLQNMLVHDRYLRISAKEALQHPFIKCSYMEHLDVKEAQMKEAYSQRGGTQLVENVRVHRCSPKVREEALSVVRSSLDSFASFAKEPLLINVGLMLLTHLVGYTAEETLPHRKAYAMLDRNGTGFLSMDSLERNFPFYVPQLPHNVEDIFRGAISADITQDGYISLGGFLSATLPDSLRSNEKFCRIVFDILDQNKDGHIDVGDLALVLRGEKVIDQETRRRYRESLAAVAGSRVTDHVNFDQFYMCMKGECRRE